MRITTKGKKIEWVGFFFNINLSSGLAIDHPWPSEDAAEGFISLTVAKD